MYTKNRIMCLGISCFYHICWALHNFALCYIQSSGYQLYSADFIIFQMSRCSCSKQVIALKRLSYPTSYVIWGICGTFCVSGKWIHWLFVYELAWIYVLLLVWMIVIQNDRLRLRPEFWNFELFIGFLIKCPFVQNLWKKYRSRIRIRIHSWFEIFIWSFIFELLTKKNIFMFYKSNENENRWQISMKYKQYCYCKIESEDRSSVISIACKLCSKSHLTL